MKAKKSRAKARIEKGVLELQRLQILKAQNEMDFNDSAWSLEKKRDPNAYVV